MTMQTLSQLLTSTSANNLVAVNPAWTRTDFHHAVAALSDGLKQRQVRSVALWFEDAAQFACALLAAWGAGAEVFLPPNLAAENREWAGQADVWLSDVPELFADGTVWSPQDWQDGHMPSETMHIADDCRLWLKTSGSSGKPQVVMKTAAHMQAEAQALAQTLPFGQQGQVVAVGSVNAQHMYGLTFRIFTSLLMGWAIERRQQVYPEHLLSATLSYAKCVWITSPAVLNRLGEGRDWPQYQNKVCGVISAGGVLPEQTAQLLAKQMCVPFEIYGSTETGVIAQRQYQCQWQTIAGVDFGQDETGALWAQSPWSERVQTADVIERSEAGFLLLGRRDRIIKFEDKRVSLAHLENDLLAHSWVADVACGIPPQQKRIAAWVALNSKGIEAFREQGRGAVVHELKQYLAATQDKVALPRFWRFASELPRNPQSKIAQSDFQTAFSSKQTEPEWGALQEVAENEWQITSRVPLDLAYFPGHFAQFHLVPGVVELQWVQNLARQFEWGQRIITQVENLKYQQFLRPNDEIHLSLKYDATRSKLTFKLRNQEAVCASGRIVYQAI